MNINRNSLRLGAIISLCIIGIISITLYFAFKDREVKEEEGVKDTLSVMRGVPSDAILIFHFVEMSHFSNLVIDTLSFGEQIIDKNNSLIEFQRELSSISEIDKMPFVYSLHYSAKNEVSFLQVVPLEGGNESKVKGILERSLKYIKEYNGVKIYGRVSSVNAAIYEGVLIVSSSISVLESSIRHLNSNTSILDNLEFSKLSNEYGVNSALYVNNKQIGKFFSGEVTYNYLGYSDFFLNFASWSVFEFTPSGGKLNLSGKFLDNKDPRNLSSIFYKIRGVECEIGEILPFSTLFALWLPLPSTPTYLSALNSFMEVHRSNGRYAYKQNLVAIEGELKPLEWADSLNIEGIAVAFCKFGDKHEWVTLLKERSAGWSKKIKDFIVNRERGIESAPYKYRGYLASVYGEPFGWNSEEYYSKIGDWTIISSKSVIDEYNSGAAYFYNLSYYLAQTPAKDYLKEESLSKVLINVKESPDTLLQIFKPYLRDRFKSSAQSHNFEYITLDVTHKSSINVDINYYAQNLLELPKPPVVEEGVLPIIIDSTIVLPKGPYEIYDVAKKEPVYLAQLPNNQLQYLDKNKKGIWTIPFNSPICGAVEQIDIYNNGKLQMLFIAGDKLYLLDRAARFVNGYPVKLSHKVIYGPKIVELDENISFMTLNEDNSISQYTLDGKRVKGWSDIKAPEFIKELPTLEKLGAKRYWVLRSQLSTRLYNLDGSEVLISDSKRIISPESSIEFIGSNSIKVRGVDERYFILDLETGKTRKVK